MAFVIHRILIAYLSWRLCLVVFGVVSSSARASGHVSRIEVVPSDDALTKTRGD